MGSKWRQNGDKMTTKWGKNVDKIAINGDKMG